MAEDDVVARGGVVGQRGGHIGGGAVFGVGDFAAVFLFQQLQAFIGGLVPSHVVGNAGQDQGNLEGLFFRHRGAGKGQYQTENERQYLFHLFFSFLSKLEEFIAKVHLKKEDAVMESQGIFQMRHKRLCAQLQQVGKRLGSSMPARRRMASAARCASV